jgi:hypothetical protein
MYILPYSHWTSLSESESESKEPATISPTHEELSGLHWFRALDTLCKTLGGGTEWTTGKIAYDNGSRKISLQYYWDITNPDNIVDNIFYPKKGTLVLKASGNAIKRGIDYSSLAGWDSALFHLYLTAVSGALWLPNITHIREVFAKQDSDKLVAYFKRTQDRLAQREEDPLPDEFLSAVLKELDPEGSKRLRFRLSLGLT